MHWLTSSLVRPECIILLRRVILQSLREYPHGFTEKNVAAERVATLHDRNGRVYWIWDVPPSLVGVKDDRCIFPWIEIRSTWLVPLTRLGDNAANPKLSNHCLHASHWIVIFEGARRRRASPMQRCQRRSRCICEACIYSMQLQDYCYPLNIVVIDHR